MIQSSNPHRLHRVAIAALLSFLVALLPFAPVQVDAQPFGPVRINEFLTSNVNGIVDNTGSFEDWIELYNSSGASVDLAGWSLTAGNDVFTFLGGTSIPAASYLVLFASGEIGRTTNTEIHLPFKLSGDGESLVLQDAVGTISEPAWPAPGFPPQVADDSYGISSGGTLRFFTTPTPGQANGGGVAGRVEPVSFSIPHGYYSAAQQVVLTTTTPGATIRYTLDGSTPTTTTGIAVSAGTSIAVSATSIVRTIAYRSGWAASGIETRSYLFADDIVDQPTTPPTGWPANNEINGMQAFYGFDQDLTPAQLTKIEQDLVAIPTISITTDLDNLFDPLTGIWTNPTQRGTEWEKPVAIELIDPSGAQPGFEINGGLRIRGNSSRSPGNFKHSMRLVFGDDYGDGELEYPLFGDEGVDVFESVDLKTAQSWSWNSTNAANANRGTEATWLRDVWNRDSQGAMGQPYARGRFVHAFINGQYWGLYMTEERVSNQYAAQYSGGQESDFDIIKRQTGLSLLAGSRHVEARDGTLDDWLSLWPLVQDHSLTNAEWATFRDEVDLESLADFYVLMFYGGDSDSTPRYTLNISNNWLAFRNRARVGDAAKWQFNDRDSESALCTNVNAAREPDWNPTPPWDLDGGIGDYLPPENFLAPAWLFEAALTQPEFVQIFKDRVQLHMLTPGGALTVSESVARLNARSAVVDLAIDAEAGRWGDTRVDPGFDRTDWTQATQTVRDCFQLRTTVIEQYLREDGLWPDADPPAISLASGAVPFGTSVSLSAPAGTVWVTTDGSDPLGANAAPSPAAFQYAGPISITGAVTIKARSDLGNGVWSTLAEGLYTLSTPPDPPRLLLNEFNAVSGSNYLGGGSVIDVANGTDATFGRVAGNGGDWFELVVLEDGLDIRGWSVEVWDDDAGVSSLSARLVFRNDPILSSLRSGTVITVSEDIADDVSYLPQTGDWHINLQANDAGDGGYFTAASESSFAINNDNTQIALFDGNGDPEALPTGEGTVPAVSISSTEVFKLEVAPTAAITPGSTGYSDGTSSTWGLPNMFAGAEVQDLGQLRITFGDPSCDASIGVVDALFIAQFRVGNRTDATCPLSNPATQIFSAAGDVNNDGATTIVDALLISQCEVGIPNSFCPEG